MRPLCALHVIALAAVAAGLLAFTPRPARPIVEDPAHILFRPNHRDVLRIHGAVTPATPIDPVGEGFTLLLRNVDGVLFRAALLPGDLSATRRATFLDRAAPSGAGRRNGLYKVSLLRQGARYHFGVQAYADLARATVPEMTIRITIGDDVFTSDAKWRRTRSGWALAF